MHRKGHKDRQVCRQVFDALSYALTELDDPVIAELALVAVDPAPDASRVLVTLAPSRGDIDLDDALARVRARAGELRVEVAAEVNRRRIPELTFRVTRAGDLAPSSSE
jgi:ribosome-binding factor A